MQRFCGREEIIMSKTSADLSILFFLNIKFIYFFLDYEMKIVEIISPTRIFFSTLQMQ